MLTADYRVRSYVIKLKHHLYYKDDVEEHAYVRKTSATTWRCCPGKRNASWRSICKYANKLASHSNTAITLPTQAQITFDYVEMSWILKSSHRCKYFKWHHSAMLPSEWKRLVDKHAQRCECLCISQQCSDYRSNAKSNVSQSISLPCREDLNLSIAGTTRM